MEKKKIIPLNDLFGCMILNIKETDRKKKNSSAFVDEKLIDF